MAVLIVVEDGPAKDAPAMVCGRAPEFLRIVVDRKGQWDVLDQLDDHPATDETIHVYRCRDGVGHVRGDRGGFSGPMCFYRHYPSISPDHARDNASWRRTVEIAANAERDAAASAAGMGS